MRYTIKGVDEIQKKLEQLEKKEVAKIAREELRDTAKETMLKAAKQNALSMVGGDMGTKLANHLSVRKAMHMWRGSYGMVVVVRADEMFVHESKRGKRSYIPFAIEYGHVGPNSKNGLIVAEPIPFMRNAYEDEKWAALDMLEKNMIDRIEAAVKK